MTIANQIGMQNVMFLRLILSRSRMKDEPFFHEDCMQVLYRPMSKQLVVMLPCRFGWIGNVRVHKNDSKLHAWVIAERCHGHKAA